MCACVQSVVVNHMGRHMLDMMRLVSMRACFSIRGGVCDTYEIQGSSREFHCFKLYRSFLPTYYLLWVTTSMVYPWEAVGIGYIT